MMAFLAEAADAQANAAEVTSGGVEKVDIRSKDIKKSQRSAF